MLMKVLLLLVMAVGLSFAVPGSKETDAEAVAIRATALDYIDGFYTGDAARMERALHPSLAKRIVITDPKTGRSTLNQSSAMELVQIARGGAGKKYPENRRQEDVTVLDHFQDTAMVKIVAADWIDYLQMARFNGEWKIINVLWVLKPKLEQGIK
jgi:hypothetical protein